MIRTSALIYFTICLSVVLFHVCMIAGAPWGRLTQGGANAGKLPARGRIAAGFAALLMLAMGLSMISAAGFTPNWPIWTGWTTLALTVISVIANLATPSIAERKLWGPVTIIMLVLATFVMVSL